MDTNTDQTTQKNPIDATRTPRAAMMSAKDKDLAFKHANTISELLKVLSDRLWSDDAIQDRFALAALVDGAISANTELNTLIEERL